MDEQPYKDDCHACRVKRFWFEDLKFCGCGTQGEVLGVFRDAMTIMHDRSEGNRAGSETAWMDGCAKLDQLWNGNVAFEYLVQYTLCAHDLTEHGGSVGGSWLRPEGEKLLEAMVGKTDEELDEMLEHDEYDHEFDAQR